MQLSRLLEEITYESVRGNADCEIRAVCYHSGQVKEGALFVCLRGERSDGHEYLGEALANGAAAVMVEAGSLVEAAGEEILYTEQKKWYLSDVTGNYGAAVVAVRDTRAALARAAAAFYGYPARKLKMIGITGTKGKTTATFLTAGILREAGYKTGVIGTIWTDCGREIYASEHTTPEAPDLQRCLAEMVENGCVCCVMEVSSQGIKMRRVDGIRFDIGVFLNIEPDHIGKGEHVSFSEYLHCKSRLMQCSEVGIVNFDDVNTPRILQGHTCRVEGFSRRGPGEALSEAAVRSAHEAFYMIQGKLYSCFQIVREAAGGGGRREFTVQMQLPGSFNIYNALAAVSVAFHFGVREGQIERALRQQMVPGRCENVSGDAEYVILIDYAHNEMSLYNLLTTLREFGPERLIVLFGCGGNRSGLRRGRMGETAGRLADFTILTSDNPRWEDPERILDDIEAGIRETGGAYVRIADRREAVRYAVAQARKGDILVLAGKGHEAYQEIGGKKYPMSDHELVMDAAARL